MTRRRRCTMPMGTAVLCVVAVAVVAAVDVAVALFPAVHGADGAPTPPTPPKMPQEWETQVAAGTMLVSQTPQTPELSPNIGNGFLSLRLGPNSNDPTLDVVGGLQDAQTHLGGLHLAGVFNGASNSTPSHRAQFPAVHNIQLMPAPGSSMVYVAGALDMMRAVVHNRTMHAGPDCNGTVQVSSYAHRQYRSLMVTEITWVDAPSNAQQAKCLVHVNHLGVNRTGTPDFTLADVSSSHPSAAAAGATVWSGTTLVPEVQGVSDVTTVGAAFSAIPTAVGLTSANPTARFLFVAHTSLEKGSALPTPSAAAASDFVAYSSIPGDVLFDLHVAKWWNIWQSRVEVSGNTTVTASLMSSLYYIRSAFRQDWPYGLSPGGLAIDSYNGHSFWDTETWMFPTLALLSPDDGHSLLQYRAARLGSAISRGEMYGYGTNAADWPWESALTGFDCVKPPNIEGHFEQHISGDIVMAFRLMYYLYPDNVWLRDIAWPVLNATCTFWGNRVTKHDGTGNWTILNVQPPDERAGVVNSSAYTNAVAASALSFCIDVGEILSISTPSFWAEVASNIYLPISYDLYSKGPVHPEFEGFHGQEINQADVALLQYPLLWPMPVDVAANDLAYYTPLTPYNGMYTGDSAYSIAWLALGSRENADKQWANAFLHMGGGFNVWKERAGPVGGHENFITGAGGYLQNLVNGYGGLRVLANHLSFSPMLPPSVDSVSIRRMTYQGAPFNLLYNATHMEVELLDSTGTSAAGDSRGSTAQSGLRGSESTRSMSTPLPPSESSFCVDIAGARTALATNVPFIAARAPFLLLPTSESCGAPGVQPELQFSR